MSLCPSGKVPYNSRRHLKRYLKRHGFRGNRLYKCSDCGYWHHTSVNHRVAAWYRERR